MQSGLGKFTEFLSQNRQSRNFLESLILGLALLYLLTTFSLLVWGYLTRGVFSLYPDYLLFLFIVLTAVFFRQKLSSLKDLVLGILLLLAYDAMRGYAYQWGGRVNYQFPIQADLFIGGGRLPTAILQAFIDSHGWSGFFGLVSILVYTLHFAVPLAFAYIIWLSNRKDFARYMAAVVILSYLALFTFWVFPVAPPWLAAEKGLIPIEKKFDTIATDYDLRSLTIAYDFINANPVAAIPSLHFGYPFLALVFALTSGRRSAAVFFAAYTLVVSFSIVYLGEHYVIDLVAGGIYALAALFLSSLAIGRLEKNISRNTPNQCHTLPHG
ncbi:PAP2 superfamily protein [Candidatus Gugararchaeum adminiculabundum]|nr:PAP2 superfamily protein [Candidatus Gugararchaeum adminiculabundum]